MGGRVEEWVCGRAAQHRKHGSLPVIFLEDKNMAARAKGRNLLVFFEVACEAAKP